MSVGQSVICFVNSRDSKSTGQIQIGLTVRRLHANVLFLFPHKVFSLWVKYFVVALPSDYFLF